MTWVNVTPLDRPLDHIPLHFPIGFPTRLAIDFREKRTQCLSSLLKL
jgi:hypothetical protein